MQNKPNLMDTQMNVSPVKTMAYENIRLCSRGKNKPKQTQFQTRHLLVIGRFDTDKGSAMAMMRRQGGFSENMLPRISRIDPVGLAGKMLLSQRLKKETADISLSS